MNQKTILCYGDSNTWGYVPNTDPLIEKARYLRKERWPGRLQALLGENYYVVEEGLNGRTTNIDYMVPPDRNGKTYLAPCLYSHAPIDLVILALGGNDTKTYFNRSPQQIKDGLSELVDMIQTSKYGPKLQTAPRILITTPAIPFAFVEDCVDEEGVNFLKGGILKVEALIELYAELAREKACFYLDLSTVIKSSAIDGVHYDKEAHAKCAEVVREEVVGIFK